MKQDANTFSIVMKERPFHYQTLRQIRKNASDVFRSYGRSMTRILLAKQEKALILP